MLALQGAELLLPDTKPAKNGAQYVLVNIYLSGDAANMVKGIPDIHRYEITCYACLYVLFGLVQTFMCRSQ